MGIKRVQKLATGNKNSRSLTNEEEIIAFANLIEQWELKFFDTNGQRKEINRWLDEMEGTYNAGMLRNDMLAGYGGWCMPRQIKRLGYDFELYREVYANQISALNTVDMTQSRLMRNVLGLNIKNNPQKVETVFRAYDEAIKGAFGKTLNKIKRDFLSKPIMRDLVFFVDSGGKRWRPDKYAEMWARTRSREVEDILMTKEMESLGLDVIQISNVNTTTPICLQYEGKFFSYSGKTPGLPVIDILPPFHPNCKHRKFPVDPEKVGMATMTNKNRKVNNNVEGLKSTWSLAEKKQIAKQEIWNTNNRSK